MKLNYCSRLIWRKIFFFKKNLVFKMSEKVFFNRGSIIPRPYKFSQILIYTGKSWQPRLITQWHIGFKIGSFTWNRKPAFYKKKKLKKKKKK